MCLLMILINCPAYALKADPVIGGQGQAIWTRGAVIGRLLTFFSPSSSMDVNIPELRLNVDHASTIDFTVADCCITGDAVELLIDGNITSWTTEVFPHGIGGNFIGIMDDLFLDVGSHSLQLALTDAESTNGSMAWVLSPAIPVAAVPQPTTLALLSIGLFGLTMSRRTPVQSSGGPGRQF